MTGNEVWLTWTAALLIAASWLILSAPAADLMWREIQSDLVDQMPDSTPESAVRALAAALMVATLTVLAGCGAILLTPLTIITWEALHR